MADYFDNKRLTEVLEEYRLSLERWEANPIDNPKPSFPQELGKGILQIAEGVARRNGFKGYTFKRDMIGDGILHCMKYWRNFNPAKGSLYSYLSQICFRAFIKRINAETKYVQRRNEIKTLADHFGLTSEDVKRAA